MWQPLQSLLDYARTHPVSLAIIEYQPERQKVAGDIARELAVMLFDLERVVPAGSYRCLWQPLQSILTRASRVPLEGVSQTAAVISQALATLVYALETEQPVTPQDHVFLWQTIAGLQKEVAASHSEPMDY